jgi:nucleotide-binding universal stress UspA family protein
MEPWAAPPECFEQLEKSAREAAEGVIKNALLMLSSIEDRALKITTAVIEGPPRQVIVEEAVRWGADLSSWVQRALGAWNRLLLGSVASAVVHHAKCSVEIVRRRQPGESKV